MDKVKTGAAPGTSLTLRPMSRKTIRAAIASATAAGLGIRAIEIAPDQTVRILIGADRDNADQPLSVLDAWRATRARDAEGR